MKTAKLSASVSCLRSLLCLLVLTLFAAVAPAATVTTNGGSGLDPTYPDLASAIAALNGATITSPVVITTTGTETAPAGGYSITQTGGTSTNTIVIDGSSTTTITASDLHTVGALNDAIFKLIGADFVTLQGFTMQEDATNNTVTTAASNDMTEWGVALLYASTTDGAQNNTIQNNTISLNRIYQNTFGIYSNSTHSATSITTGGTATGAAGGNSGLKVYGNSVSNVNLGIVVVGPTAAADHNTGIDIGGAALATGNTLTDYGTTGTFSSYANVSGTVYGILVRNSTGFNISFNSITSSSGASGVTAGTLRGIYVPSASNQPVGTFTNTISDNTLAVTSHVVGGILQGITVESTTSSATSTTNIDNNDFTALNHTIAAATGVITAISQVGSTTAGPLNHSISNNTFTNITSSSTGNFIFISNSWSRPTNGIGNVNDNSIVTAFNKTGAGGTVTLYTSNSSSGATVTEINTGNDFSNITVTGATTIAGWASTDGGSPSKTVTGNTFSNWTGGTSAITGLAVSFSGSANVSSNTVSNITGGGTVVGITGSSGTQTFSQNTVHTMTGTGTGAATGLSVTGGTAQTLSKNKVYDISNSNAGGAVNGILVTAGTTVTIANNLVGNLTAPAASGTDAVRGISSTSTAASSTINLFYNTIYINAASSGANFGTSGVFHTTSTTATTAALNMRNNAIVNTSTPNGAGLTVAYRRSSGAAGTLANYASTSNNNNLYAGTPGPSNLIYSDGTSTAQTIGAYTGGIFTAGTIAPRDSASFTESPTFLSTTGASADFLHIDPSVATQMESAAAPITGVADDYDGDTRNASTPDVGADEFNGILLDLSPPTISYTALGNTASLGSRTLTATITDASGVPTAGTGLPVLYWNINAGSYVAATAVSLGSNQHEFTFGSGVSTGDVVSYYVVAQDSAATPNVGANPSAGAGGFTADPPAAATPPTTPNSYTILGTISGTFTVGAGGNYGTLTAAIADLNNNVLTGPVVLELTDSTYSGGETFPVVLNTNPGSSAANTITIKPAIGNTVMISGSVAGGAVIKLNGASFVTIDGSNSGGTDRSLTITNTSTTTPNVVWFGSVGTTPITDDILKNCIVINGVNTSSAVVISDAATAGNAGFFSNITIQNNSVQRAFVGVFAQGGTSPQNGSNLVYTQNDLSTSGADAIRLCGLYMQGVNGATVSQNIVGNFDPVSGENDAGIWLATGTINATVSGNTVSGLNYTGTAAFSPVGINVTPTVAASNNVITGNTVSNMLSGGSSSTALVAGVSVTGASGAVTIEKNDIQNIGNSNGATWPAVGINLNGGSNNVVRNNFVSRIFNDQTAGTGAFGPQFGASGIRLNLGTGHQVYHNSVHLYGAMAGTVSSNQVICLAVSGTGVTGCDIRNNILSNEMTGGNPTGGNTRFVGIHLPPGGTAAMNLTLNNNAYYEGTHANCRMAVVGTTVGSGDFAAANFDPNSNTPATNFRSYSSTLSAAGTNDNASLATTAAVPFVSATDLHLNASSVPGVTGSGAAVSVTDDIDGDLRQSPPDIGADEVIVVDADADGVPDDDDNCPLVANADQLDNDLDGEGDACDADDDNDGVLDGDDNCPTVANASQLDTDLDGQGDACDSDDDNDGFNDVNDCAPLDENINPGAAEVCDGVDNDCDGDTDDADSNLSGAPIWFDDPDGDGIGSGAGIPACTQPAGTVATGGDNCPTIANAGQTDTDADGQGDACDVDDDGDGAADAKDNCPLSSNADQADNDMDGLGNACDACPNDANNDADGDGLCADVDNCPSVANPDQTNTDADTEGDACDLDDDNDGIADVIDNCPLVANADQINTDGDGEGDACDTDDDGDGVPDIADNCPLASNPDQLNTDGDLQGDACDPDDDNDTVLDGADNCPLVANIDQANADADALGDACDTCPLDANNDIDGDGICGDVDNCPFAANPDQLDTDEDGIGDACDNCPGDPLGDADGDGICGSVDNCPTTPNSLQEDDDADNVGNACDNCLFNPNPDQADCDEDGIGDACEGKDCNENGVPDSCDIANGDSDDINFNGVPDECECPANTNTTGSSANQVDVDDLIAVILAWGACDEPCPPYCMGDINHDCAVDVDDLVSVILAWGPCP